MKVKDLVERLQFTDKNSEVRIAMKDGDKVTEGRIELVSIVEREEGLFVLISANRKAKPSLDEDDVWAG